MRRFLEAAEGGCVTTYGTTLMSCRARPYRRTRTALLTKMLSENFKYLYLMFADSPRFDGFLRGMLKATA